MCCCKADLEGGRVNISCPFYVKRSFLTSLTEAQVAVYSKMVNYCRETSISSGIFCGAAANYVGLYRRRHQWIYRMLPTLSMQSSYPLAQTETQCHILNSPGGSTLQCDTWLWDHVVEFARWQHPAIKQCDTWLWDPDIEFARWQNPAMWHEALGWHAIKFTKTSAVLKFYFRFWFRPDHCNRHVSWHHYANFYPNQTTHSRKMTSCRYSRWRIAVILGVK